MPNVDTLSFRDNICQSVLECHGFLDAGRQQAPMPYRVQAEYRLTERYEMMNAQRSILSPACRLSRCCTYAKRSSIEATCAPMPPACIPQHDRLSTVKSFRQCSYVYRLVERYLVGGNTAVPELICSPVRRSEIKGRCQEAVPSAVLVQWRDKTHRLAFPRLR